MASYEAALDLPDGQAADYQARLVRLLTARDDLASALAAARPLSPEMVARLAALDEQLKQKAPAMAGAAGSAALASWRDAVQPPDSAWWWRLDERAAALAPKPSALWTVAAGFFITVAISLMADIARRFLTGGPDFIGVFSTLAQGFLALLAGRALTQSGGEALERGLRRLGVRYRRGYLLEATFALAVLLIVLALRISLPAIARSYNDRAVLAQQQGRLTSAIQGYQRAINLSPDYAQAHYNLGTAYEDVLEYDKALAEYQTAIRADSTMYAAYNNLGRVYMLQKADYTGALRLFNLALDLEFTLPEPQHTLVRYSLLKNRGWANFGLKYLELAQLDLHASLALRPDGAAAHCLLAQVIEARRGDVKAALAEWEACLRYEKADPLVVEANWLGLARERLSTGGAK